MAEVALSCLDFLRSLI